MNLLAEFRSEAGQIEDVDAEPLFSDAERLDQTGVRFRQPLNQGDVHNRRSAPRSARGPADFVALQF